MIAIVLVRIRHQALELEIAITAVVPPNRASGGLAPQQPTGEWKYRIEGRTVDDCDVAVVFKFEGERAVLITVRKVK